MKPNLSKAKSALALIAVLPLALIMAGCNPAPQDSVAVQPGATQIVPETTFTSGLGKWYEHVWYNAKSSGGEVTTGANGVSFKAVASNSRSGIMLDLNKDVSTFTSLRLTVKGTVTQQTLPGTGYNGREAPVAVAIAYKDAKGADHKLLGEDPKADGQMFWRGFYFLGTNNSSSVTTNGVLVEKGKEFTFNFDLMTLKDKPTYLYFIGLEGAGWKDRQGTVSSLSLVAN